MVIYIIKKITMQSNKINNKNIKQLFKSSYKILHDARNQLKIIDLNDKKLVIKKFKKPGIIKGFIYSFLCQSKAQRAYEYATKINKFTPEPKQYLESYKYKLLADSYFISEYFDFDFDIRKPLLDKKFDNKIDIFRQFANFVFELHNNNILHKDLSPGNILIKKHNENYIFKIVDINRMQFGKLSIKQRAKNFNKLWASNIDLEIILNEYNKLLRTDNVNFINLGLKYNQQNKNRKNFKKKLKGEEVSD